MNAIKFVKFGSEEHLNFRGANLESSETAITLALISEQKNFILHSTEFWLSKTANAKNLRDRVLKLYSGVWTPRVSGGTDYHTQLTKVIDDINIYIVYTDSLLNEEIEAQKNGEGKLPPEIQKLLGLEVSKATTFTEKIFSDVKKLTEENQKGMKVATFKYRFYNRGKMTNYKSFLEQNQLVEIAGYISYTGSDLAEDIVFAELDKLNEHQQEINELEQRITELESAIAQANKKGMKIEVKRTTPNRSNKAQEKINEYFAEIANAQAGERHNTLISTGVKLAWWALLVGDNPAELLTLATESGGWRDDHADKTIKQVVEWANNSAPSQSTTYDYNFEKPKYEKSAEQIRAEKDAEIKEKAEKVQNLKNENKLSVFKDLKTTIAYEKTITNFSGIKHAICCLKDYKNKADRPLWSPFIFDSKKRGAANSISKCAQVFDIEAKEGDVIDYPLFTKWRALPELKNAIWHTTPSSSEFNLRLRLIMPADSNRFKIIKLIGEQYIDATCIGDRARMYYCPTSSEFIK